MKRRRMERKTVRPVERGGMGLPTAGAIPEKKEETSRLLISIIKHSDNDSLFCITSGMLRS